MAEVQAVKNPDTIKLISHLLEIRSSKQMSLVWNIGLNLALRISDLLSIKFSDIQDDRLIIRESKTGKKANIKLNPKAQTLIKQIQTDHPQHLYLFQSYRSQQSLNSTPKPLSRRAVTKAFAEVGEEVKVSLGTHSIQPRHYVGLGHPKEPA
jgi:integrase